MKLLETEWIKFRRGAIPADAGDIQLQETRRAFFAGAWAFYSLVMGALDPDSEPTAKDVELMAALDGEMREFAERVRKGWA